MLINITRYIDCALHSFMVNWWSIVVCKLDLSIENYALNDVPRFTFCQAVTRPDIFSRLHCAGGSKGFSLKLNVGNKIKCPGRLRMNTALIRSDCKAILMSTSHLCDSHPEMLNNTEIKFQGHIPTLTISPLKLSVVLLPNIVCNSEELFVMGLNIVWEPGPTLRDTGHAGLTLWHVTPLTPGQCHLLCTYHWCHSQSGIISFLALS